MDFEFFCIAWPLTNDARIWKCNGVATPCVIGWATRCAGASLPRDMLYSAIYHIPRVQNPLPPCDSATQNSLLNPRPSTATKDRIRPGNVRNRHHRVDPRKYRYFAQVGEWLTRASIFRDMYDKFYSFKDRMKINKGIRYLPSHFLSMSTFTQQR